MSNAEFDMHCHTDWSDGQDTPWQLVSKAKAAGLLGVAKTDHDDYNGWSELFEAGLRFQISVCLGIEISCSYQGFDVHILGYNLNPTRLYLLDEVLANYHLMRHQRAKKILELYAKSGVMQTTCAEIKERLKFNCTYVPLTRIMEYRALTGGIDFKQAEKELKRGSPYYVGYDKSKIIQPEEAVKLILSAEGVPVLAHPGDFNKRTDGDKNAAEKILQEVLENLLAVGLEGLECFYPSHSEEQTKSYLELARKMNLLVTGGTDYHGSFKTGRALGQTGITYAQFRKIIKA